MGNKRKASPPSFIKVMEVKQKRGSGEVAITLLTKACIEWEKLLRGIAFEGYGLVSAREVTNDGSKEHASLHKKSKISEGFKDRMHYHLVFKSRGDAELFLQSLEAIQSQTDLARAAASMKSVLSWNAGSLITMQEDDLDCAKMTRFVGQGQWPANFFHLNLTLLLNNKR